VTDVAFGDGRAHFFVPPERSSEPRPLLLLLHGLGGSGAAIARDFGLEAFARHKGFVFVAPDGTLDGAGRRFWNAGNRCCNFENAPIDDVSRLHGLIEHAIRELSVDRARVSIVGYSNGGFMAHRLACERSGSIASVVSIAATGPEPECDAANPVSILEIHGDRDPIVPFTGGHLFGRPEMPRVNELSASLAPWLKRNGCAGAFRLGERVDLVSDIAGTETDVLRPSRCAAAIVELWAVRGGTHYLSLGQPALDKIWEFLGEQTLASGGK